MSSLQNRLKPLRTPALHLVASQEAQKSYLGGSPHLPDTIAWPTVEGRQLRFLARLSLAELHQRLSIEWLPTHGALLFFYDEEGQAWGFDPADRGHFAVLHVPDEAHSPIAGQEETHTRVNLELINLLTYPSDQRLDLSDSEIDEYNELVQTVYQDQPKHQVAGYPVPIQGDDMQLECQLVSNGLYCGDQTGYNDPRAESLAPGAADWRLLLQLDSDDDANFMWGDMGTLYFWVKADEAAAGKFDNVWCILQCY